MGPQLTAQNLSSFGRLADCKSAIQQIKNLRYSLFPQIGGLTVTRIFRKIFGVSRQREYRFEKSIYCANSDRSRPSAGQQI
jgi:hypothetical protein